MSHIANAIEELLVKNKLTGSDLSRASGLNTAQISRLRSGEKIRVNPDDLFRIAHGFCPTANADFVNEVHAQLLRAHLRDECTGPGAKLISIIVNSSMNAAAPSEVDQPPSPVLPPRDRQDLDLIASRITKDHHVRDFVRSVANLCRGRGFPRSQAGQCS